MTAVIVANGEFPRKEYPLWLLKSADVVVCCDSATSIRRLKRLGVEPVAVVGDMDSLPPAQMKALGKRAVRVARAVVMPLVRAMAASFSLRAISVRSLAMLALGSLSGPA